MNYAIYPIPHWLTSAKWNEKKDWWKDIVIRDKYSCADCHNGNEMLIVHHIDKNRQNNTPNNLVLLCKKCHSCRHGRDAKKNPILLKLESYIPDKKIRVGTLTYIANELGVSRERVRQIAKMAGYQPARNVSRKNKTVNCWVCGKKFIKSSNLQKRLCCSSKCLIIHNEQKYWGIYQCEWCGFYYKNRKSRQKLIGRRFCSNRCKGKWLASKYGIGTPNNSCDIRKKYPSNEIMQKDFAKELFTKEEFAKKYGYASTLSASYAISSLLFNNVIEKYKVRGLYRLKIKTPR